MTETKSTNDDINTLVLADKLSSDLSVAFAVSITLETSIFCGAKRCPLGETVSQESNVQFLAHIYLPLSFKAQMRLDPVTTKNNLSHAILAQAMGPVILDEAMVIAVAIFRENAVKAKL